ncbi:tRNA-dihydrouridine synthase [Emcibacter nanhaiensis]|uniref:tRNA-dihydrouridine(16) synthase n=1 Tax=Emcibacter nanhaiensis TaxID=1505037 RepID=A0A501PBA8_9PROT|nr:tRNA-dihydrouridine synthase [Emcibacter nanhaiensis]TPD57478.1 tRNA dihydrouridine(16) synthase DusC [Emcibacter nanhaiensis]
MAETLQSAGKIYLAPMEGVVDYVMRDMLTSVGNYELCVTEFVRVTNQLYKPALFYKYCPELKSGAKTPSGTPVMIQLLGQDPDWMAENAARAVELGSPGVDLNFGCPAKTVNKSKGGAILLREPETLYKIISAVRTAVPANLPVSAKMRLGYEDKSLALDNARAIEAAGANRLTVHARTKVEGYKPPAHWHWIAKIREEVTLPLVANGDIWTAEDAEACRRESGCQDIMIGRGAMALPNLSRVIADGAAPLSWDQVRGLLLRYAGIERSDHRGGFLPSRIKQWFTYLRLCYPAADEMFRDLKRLQALEEISAMLSDGNQ